MDNISDFILVPAKIKCTWAVGERTRHKTKYSYKHKENQKCNSKNLTSLAIKVKELLEYKIIIKPKSKTLRMS